MFSKTYFDKKVERFNQTKEEFNACFERKDYFEAKERLENLYSLIESMKATARCSAYEELDFESYDYAMKETAFCERFFKQAFQALTSALVDAICK